MKLPRDLSGATLVKLLVREFGYRRVHWHVELHPACRGGGAGCGPERDFEPIVSSGIIRWGRWLF